MTEKEMQIYINLSVLKIFEFDMEKAAQWFSTPNLNLGGFRPIRLIESGKIEKVYEFVRDSEGME